MKGSGFGGLAGFACRVEVLRLQGLRFGAWRVWGLDGFGSGLEI